MLKIVEVAIWISKPHKKCQLYMEHSNDIYNLDSIMFIVFKK